jgi:choline transporter-like protein 2/4/5
LVARLWDPLCLNEPLQGSSSAAPGEDRDRTTSGEVKGGMSCLSGCCKTREQDEKQDETDPAERFAQADSNRRPRDVLFCLVFLAFWVGMVVVAGFAFDRGQPFALLYGLDYEGDVCATGAKSELEVQYWPNLQRVSDTVESVGVAGLYQAPRICLRKCPLPDVTTSESNANRLTFICEYPRAQNLEEYTRNDTTSGVDYPAGGDLDSWANEFQYDYFDALTDDFKELSLNFTGPCWPVLAYTSNLYWTCVFDQGPTNLVDGERFGNGSETSSVNENATDVLLEESSSSDLGSGSSFADTANQLSNTIDKFLSQGGAVFDRYIADLELAWPVIVVCGAAVPIAVSAAWLLLMRYFAGLFAWTVVIFANLAAIGIFIFFGVKAGIIGDDELTAATGGLAGETSIASDVGAAQKNKDVMTAFFITTLILAVLLFVFTILFIRRINIAVATIKVAINCIANVPSMLFYPMLPFFASAGLFIYWIFVAVYLFSVGEKQTRDDNCERSELLQYCHSRIDPTCTIGSDGATVEPCGQELVLTKDTKKALAYHFFGLLWTTQFLIASTFIVLAMVATRFYWYKGDASRMGKRPVVDSLRKTMAYYLGSAAKGAFIVALLHFVRAMVEIFEKRLKSLVNNDTAAKWILSCVKYCLWYVQKVIEYVNKNAYIMIAIEGKGYCSSASRAVQLLITNAGSVVAVNVIGDALVYLGKLAVAAISALIAFVYMEQRQYKDGRRAVSSPLLVVLVVFMMGYAIATALFAVVEMAVGTVLLSFCIDHEANNGEPQHAPKLLKDALGQADEAEKKRKGDSGNSKAASESRS